MANERGTTSKGSAGLAAEQKHDIDALERQVNEVSRSLASVITDRELKEYILAIHKPGWTTPAEFLFATGIVTSMQAQVQVLGELKQALFDGSRAIRVDER
jgi:hypothetical protein